METATSGQYGSDCCLVRERELLEKPNAILCDELQHKTKSSLRLTYPLVDFLVLLLVPNGIHYTLFESSSTTL